MKLTLENVIMPQDYPTMGTLWCAETDKVLVCQADALFKGKQYHYGIGEPHYPMPAIQYKYEGPQDYLIGKWFGFE